MSLGTVDEIIFILNLIESKILFQMNDKERIAVCLIVVFYLPYKTLSLFNQKVRLKTRKPDLPCSQKFESKQIASYLDYFDTQYSKYIQNQYIFF